MKLLSRMFNTLPKRLASAAIVALAISLPAIGLAADTVKMEGAFGVANVTAGDTTYKDSVNATYDQVVKYEVYYHNQELPDSGKIAQNVNVKIALPTAAGKVQSATATIKADNSNTVTDNATVNLDRADAYLQYIPGSAVWKHNTGTNDAVNYVETKISDAVVTSGQGLVLENEKPCYNFSATVTVLARVMVPGVKVVKEVEKANESNKWSKTNVAAPGETLKYKITYQNTGNAKQDAVVVSDNLPPNMTVVPNTTHIYNPSDVLDKTNNIASGGLDLGNYAPGAGFVVTFEAKLPAADKLACGETVFRNVGVVQPKGMQQYFDTATTTVKKDCAEQPKTPVYTCDAFDFTQGEKRTITVSKFQTTQTNGATFKNVVIDWGDSTAPLTTNAAVGKTHTFAKDGTYTVVATAHFTVDNKDVTASGANCSKSVTFTSTPTTTPPTTTTPSTPETLVNTGPGEVAGMFATVAVAGAIAHRLFLARRLAR